MKQLIELVAVILKQKKNAQFMYLLFTLCTMPHMHKNMTCVRKICY